MSNEQEQETPSANENIRRVYALPAEMVERITAFQKEKGLTSEVEAVRRLLDESLKSRDNLETLINRVLAFLGHTRIASEAAKEVLVGHPLVKTVSFGDGYVQFQIKINDGSGYGPSAATVYENGAASIDDANGLDWIPKNYNEPYAGGSIKDESEIPF